MKKYLIIVFSVLIMVGCSMSGNSPTAPAQGTMTAVVTAYNSAQLTGAVPSGAQVSYENSTHDKERVGVGQTATMLVTGLPQGWITSMRVYVHSNKTSGAGELTLSVGDSAYLHYEGTMEDWIGYYTDKDVPLTAIDVAIAYGQEPIRLTVTGTTNSLYVTRLEITYTTLEPQRDTLYLSYRMGQQYQTDTVVEDHAGGGIVLPTCPTIRVQDSDWVHVGWIEQATLDTLAQPYYYHCGITYRTMDQHHLWALYIYSSHQTLHQDTTCQSSEYALLRDNGIMARGGWNNKSIAHDMASVRKEGKDYLLEVDSVAASNRYHLYWDGDSVTIQVGEVTSTEWLGYTGSNTAKKKTSWAWKRTSDGSVFFYHDLQYAYQQEYAYSIGLEGVGMQGETQIQHKQVLWDTTQTYWLLFPTSDIPIRPYRRWSTLHH